MSGAETITSRQHAILMAVVSLYLEGGEAVGSGSVSGVLSGAAAGGMGSGGQGFNGQGISPATVRNEMNALTGAGWLEQPHTSAGRVPTARALKLYVEELSRGTRVAGAGVPGSSQRGHGPRGAGQGIEQVIDLRLMGLGGAGAVLEQTSLVLAALSSGVGLAVAGAVDAEELEHVHFSRLGAGRVLAVVVTRAGSVRDRLLQLPRDLSARELEVASAFLNDRFRGWAIEQIRAELERLLEQERSAYHAMLATVGDLWQRALPASDPPVVHVGGVGNLVRPGTAREADGERLREVMVALEAKELVVELLTAYLDARVGNLEDGEARPGEVHVVFDMERRAPELAGLVLVAAPARLRADRMGAVGVIGSTRMDYQTTMNAVRYVAEVFPRIL